MHEVQHFQSGNPTDRAFRLRSSTGMLTHTEDGRTCDSLPRCKYKFKLNTDSTYYTTKCKISECLPMTTVLLNVSMHLVYI